MQTNQMHNLRRVHIRALARLQHLHEKIRAGHYPSKRDLAACVERSLRTVSRDLQALRNDFNAPLKYDSQRRGYRYTQPEWDFPPNRFSTRNMIRDGRLDIVSVVFDEYQARWLREQPPIHSEEEREDLPDGGLRLSFPVGLNGLEVVARFCLSYAGHCHVERPAALRKLVCECLQQALIQHQE